MQIFEKLSDLVEYVNREEGRNTLESKLTP